MSKDLKTFTKSAMFGWASAAMWAAYAISHDTGALHAHASKSYLIVVAYTFCMGMAAARWVRLP